jgi:hypothetical protein
LEKEVLDTFVKFIDGISFSNYSKPREINSENLDTLSREEKLNRISFDFETLVNVLLKFLKYGLKSELLILKYEDNLKVFLEERKRRLSLIPKNSYDEEDQKLEKKIVEINKILEEKKIN